MSGSSPTKGPFKIRPQIVFDGDVSDEQSIRVRPMEDGEDDPFSDVISVRTDFKNQPTGFLMPAPKGKDLAQSAATDNYLGDSIIKAIQKANDDAE